MITRFAFIFLSHFAYSVAACNGNSLPPPTQLNLIHTAILEKSDFKYKNCDYTGTKYVKKFKKKYLLLI